MRLPESFLSILRELEARSVISPRLVGGIVRDLLMAREPTDIDVVCEESDPQTLVAKVGGAVVGHPPFCTVGTNLSGVPVEIALLTGGSLEKDLERRDFTINAMAMDPNGNIADPFDGREDVERGLLRLVPAPVSPYEADPIRVVRLLRFACTLDFAVDPETEAATKRFVREHRAEFENIPKERYGKEFLKGFASRPFDFLSMLRDYGLLTAVLPEIEAMRGVEQPPLFHPEGDVLTHTFNVLFEAQQVIRSRPEKRDVVLALAALLHDVGKPASVRPHPRYERACFFGHEEEGERLAAEILTAWAVPAAVAGEVTALVRGHMLPGGDFTERTCVKLIRRMDPENAERLFDLAFCDARGAMGTGERARAARDLFRRVRDNLLRAQETAAARKRLLDGHDVMEILGLPPGPAVGRILEELDVAVGTGSVRTRDQAGEWLRSQVRTDKV